MKADIKKKRRFLKAKKSLKDDEMPRAAHR